MNDAGRAMQVLMADDDPDDRELVRLAFDELGWHDRLAFAENGADLLTELRRLGDAARSSGEALPVLILLDLNMPRVDGREALALIKADAKLSEIPVVILSTSKTREDQSACTRLGAAEFLTKPSTYDALLELVAGLAEYLGEPRRPSTGTAR